MDATTADARTEPSTDVQRRMYELMALMKATDDRMTKGISTGEFITFYYPHRGQEAIAAALGVTLRKTDQLVTTYRGLHDHIGKGAPLVDVLAAVMGKDLGPGRGKSSMMNISAPEVGSMLSTGIVGGGVPIAVGLALSAQLEGADRVTAVCFGDGATNTGSFHEGANMAALWNLPLVLVCQNNLYGEKTPIRWTMKVGRIADRAVSYDMPGVRVNGNDPDEVYGALHEAVERARSDGGPSLVECVTFRFRGHTFGDDMKYMPKEQLAEAEAKDPIPAYRQRLLANKVCTEEELSAIEEAATAAVNDAVKQVMSAPDPSRADIGKDLYGNPTNIPF
jgi:pyruvate dehydrogenase E1 component alpha subunit